MPWRSADQGHRKGPKSDTKLRRLVACILADPITGNTLACNKKEVVSRTKRSPVCPSKEKGSVFKSAKCSFKHDDQNVGTGQGDKRQRIPCPKLRRPPSPKPEVSNRTIWRPLTSMLCGFHKKGQRESRPHMSFRPHQR